MEETKKKVSEICELKDKLICTAKEAMSKGMQNVNAHEMGEVTDMIKDLAEAEEKCWKACYYKQIVEAMKEEQEEEELMMKMGMEIGDSMDGPMGYTRGSRSGRRGYDHWRYSSGRFAPSGHGHYSSGYTPMEGDMEPWMMAEGFERPWDQMMGYSGGNRGASSSGNRSGGSQNGSSSSSGSYDGRMGYTGSERGNRYDRYNQARMGYHQSKSAADKEHMDASAREYVVDIAESVKDMWREADPAMKKEIKNKFVALTSEMN